MKSNFQILAFSVLLLFALMVGSCSDDDCPTCPEETGNLFTVTVVDTLGNPVEGIRIGSMNHYYYTPMTEKSMKPQVSTEIVFSLPEDSYVTLIMYDYYWNPVKILLDSEYFQATTVGVGWDGTDFLNQPIKYGYYYAWLKTRWVAEPDSIFIDTLALVMEVGLSSVQTLIGYTDRNGVFTTDDTLYFPCLLGNPPEVQAKDELSYPLDSLFHYSDTVTITLSTLQEGYILFVKQLIVGPNNFELVWDPSSIKK
ncbi:MAG: hypothetical protein JXA92_02925 [candidate division Zixibacteria bacterium]|nr:hypothetical protein [candidate division Zixibacteria bacterium]